MRSSATARAGESASARQDQVLCQLERRLTYFAEHTGEIDQRLQELDQEWDCERVLQAAGAGWALLGILRGLIGGRSRLLSPMLVLAVLLHSVLTGEGPAMRLLRRAGIRRRQEIELERYALKLVRGDLDAAAKTKEVRTVLDLLEAQRRTAFL